jgi:hypothetical protein
MRFAATALTVAALGILAGHGLTRFGDTAVAAPSPVEAQTGLAAMFGPAPMLTAATL